MSWAARVQIGTQAGLDDADVLGAKVVCASALLMVYVNDAEAIENSMEFACDAFVQCAMALDLESKGIAAASLLYAMSRLDAPAHGKKVDWYEDERNALCRHSVYMLCECMRSIREMPTSRTPVSSSVYSREVPRHYHETLVATMRVLSSQISA